MNTFVTFLKKIVVLGVVGAVISSCVVAFPVSAQAQTSTWSGVCVGTGPNTDVATIQGAECLIANVFIVIITIIGLIGFVMFIVGALRWMVAGGNTQSVTKARSTMMYAVVGLVVALSAFIIINLIADFTGINVIRYFRIPTSTRGIPPTLTSCSQLYPGSSCMPQNVCVSPNINHGSCAPGLVCCGP